MDNRNHRVAVVAIHGVADQKPNETAHRIANLLLGFNRNGITYSGFNESGLRVAVREVAVTPPDEQTPRRRAFQFSPRSQLMKRVHQRSADESMTAAVTTFRRARGRAEPDPEMNPADALDQAYMAEQLAGYRAQGKDAVYETVRLSGARQNTDPDAVGSGRPGSSSSPACCEVHLHEMYWADLSRAASGVIRLLVELYQLLFYLCGLGRKSLDFARAAFRGKAWTLFGFWQLAAEQALALVVPVLNLCMLGLAAVIVALHVPPNLHGVAVTATSALLLAAVAGLAMYFLRYYEPPQFWPWGTLVLLGLAGLGAWLARIVFGSGTHYLPLALLAWAIAAVLILWVMLVYQGRKPGAFPVALSAIVLMTQAMLVFYREERASTPADAPPFHAVFSASLSATELAMFLLGTAWFVFGLFCLGATITGWIAVMGVPSQQRSAAKRAAWTGNLTLVLPGLLTALLNLILWKALYLAGKGLILNDTHRPRLLGHLLNTDTPVPAAKFLEDMIHLTASPYFGVGFLLSIGAVVLAVWSLLPVVLTEFKSPKANPHEPRWLGECLDKALVALRVAGETLRCLALLIPVAYVLSFVDPTYKFWGEDFKRLAPWIVTGLGTVALALLAGSKLPIEPIRNGFRSVIDIALDVANWLRTNPVDGTPRARISARFTSLLRHLVTWRDPHDQEGYKAIVIIAHSQGTVIAAEVLRFLQLHRYSRPDAVEHHLPIYLFTMGCPLRQLYSLRFPHHYAWARHPDSNVPGTVPTSASLGVVKWVNAYRSGDYVGRWLWYPDSGDDRWTRPLAGAGGTEREFCIGAGGHNHYWDETAPAIAAELDALIGEACGCHTAKKWCNSYKAG